MSEQLAVAVGDWVAFLRDGRVVYAKVEYVTRNSLYDLLAVTTLGEVHVDRVLEVRRG